jgi:hypothetical protein
MAVNDTVKMLLVRDTQRILIADNRLFALDDVVTLYEAILLHLILISSKPYPYLTLENFVKN